MHKQAAPLRLLVPQQGRDLVVHGGQLAVHNGVVHTQQAVACHGRHHVQLQGLIAHHLRLQQHLPRSSAQGNGKVSVHACI